MAWADSARDLAHLLTDGPPLVFACIKEVARECQNMGFQQAMDMINGRKFSHCGPSVFQRGPVGGRPRIRREAQAGVEGTLAMLCRQEAQSRID